MEDPEYLNTYQSSARGLGLDELLYNFQAADEKRTKHERDAEQNNVFPIMIGGHFHNFLYSSRLDLTSSLRCPRVLTEGVHYTVGKWCKYLGLSLIF